MNLVSLALRKLKLFAPEFLMQSLVMKISLKPALVDTSIDIIYLLVVTSIDTMDLPIDTIDLSFDTSIDTIDLPVDT